MVERAKGHVKWFGQRERCGFVRPDDGTPDIYLFLSDFREPVEPSCVTKGDAVEFCIEHAPEGPRAVDVVFLEERRAGKRVRGTVKWFSLRKCYGFVERENGLADVFVHLNDFRDAADAYWLVQGDTVEFIVKQMSKGPRGLDVTVLSSRAGAAGESH